MGRILEMTRDALKDPFAAVRDAVTHGIPHAHTILSEGAFEVARGFREMLLDMSTSPVFRQRVT
jgi:hypothetical protein